MFDEWNKSEWKEDAENMAIRLEAAVEERRECCDDIHILLGEAAAFIRGRRHLRESADISSI